MSRFWLWTEDCGLRTAFGLWTEDCGLRTAFGLWTEDCRLKTPLITTPLITLLIGASFLLAACSDGAGDTASPEVLSVVGVVIAVDGNLSGIDWFTVRVDDGTDLTFAPDDHALFDNGPFSHIRDHLTSGTPIRVDYVMLDDGSNRALGAEDA